MPASVIENVITLKVSCEWIGNPDKFNIQILDSPQAWLQLGENLSEDKIKEGDDVYFECDVKSNPKVMQITWKQNVSNNIILFQTLIH